MKTRLFNPLDDYSSYSVHYVLLACRNTEDARVFTDADKNTETLAAVEQVDRLGGAVPYGQRRDVAYLVMDTRRFSQFTIDRLKYEALIRGWEKSGSHANLATTVEMTVIDSVGISFINFIQWLLDKKMQCNFDGMIFMLRVLFVGHTPSGDTTTVQTITIPMMLSKMAMNLDYAKGVYNLEFLPNTNFDARDHSRWLHAGTATTFSTGASNTLGGLINSFEDALNKQSLEFFQSARKLLDDAGAARQTDRPGGYGRQVRYQITIPETWETMQVAGWGAGGANEIDFRKNLKAQAESKGLQTDTTVSVESGLKITDVLDCIFRQVPAIAKLGAGVVDEGFVTFYNYIVGITSTDDFFIVHVDVVQFRVPNTRPDTAAEVAPDVSSMYQEVADVPGGRIPRDFIEYDYIFTGKNLDVLEFDMQMQDLLFLLAKNIEIGGGAIQRQLEEGQTQAGKKVNTAAELVMLRPYDPLLPPRNTRDELENFTQYSSLALQTQEGQNAIQDRQKYTNNLSAFYAASPITAVMKIRGNPAIMAKFSTQSFLPHSAAFTAGAQGNSTISTAAKREYRKALETQIIKDNIEQVGQTQVQTIRQEGDVMVVNSLSDAHYASRPVFVKVNIKGPNVNFETNELIQGEEFAAEVLQHNYYAVSRVTNLIEGSVFTQDIELFSHNIFGYGKIQGQVDRTPPKLT